MFSTFARSSVRGVFRRLPSRLQSQSGHPSHLTRLLSSLPRNCPACAAPLPSRLTSCPTCFHIADIPQPETYHELLDVPSTPNAFVIDQKLLRKNFLAAQQACHPDRWAKRGERERILAERLSSKVNEVYKTLQSPIERARYLLQEHGLDIQEQEPPLEDAEALMEIMETMEEIDTSDDALRLERLHAENDAHISSTISELETAFGNKDFTGAKAHLIRLIYWERIDRSLKRKLDFITH